MGPRLYIGGLIRNGFQFSFSVKGKQTEFQLYTQQASALSPNQRYGLHLGFGIKKVFSNKTDVQPTQDTK